jgi:LysM repeat protein
MNKDFLNQIPDDEKPVLNKLQSVAKNIQVPPTFQDELESQLREGHTETITPKSGWQTKILPSLGWAILIVGAVFLLNWVLHSLVPKQLPATNGTPNPSLPTEQEAPAPVVEEPLPTPTGAEYDWRGIKLYQNAQLPDSPAQVGLYEAQLDRHATLDSARALAGQFGMNGQIYETPPELGGSEQTDFLVVDGNQRLRVRSNLYFSYYPDYPRWISRSTSSQMIDQATAENLIENFLRSHGFDFDYKVESSGFHDGYYALPLTPEGLTIRHNHFSAAGFLFRFDQDNILAVEANLATYSLVDNFEVISAEDALQKLLNPNITAGLIEGGHSVGAPIQAWYRPRPENQTITLWGWVDSFKSAEGGAPLITFDGYQAIGNLAGLAEFTPKTFIEATGQFQTADGNKIFNVESWQVFDGHEDGPVGTIQRDGDQVILTTLDDRKLILPDIPTDMPLPMENAFVLGVAQGDVFEWKLIDTRMQGGGGGGGGGGSGFYKPNLTGTPVPLPTTQAQPETDIGTGEYIVQEGDTLSGIAETYGITVDELMQANGLNETTIFAGQTLVIPGTQGETSLVGQTLDGQRGMLTVTITNKQDGSQSVDYRLQIEEKENRYQLIRLEGDGLDELQTHNNLPIDIWGTVERYDTDLGMRIPVVNVERFEIPYPDLQYQIYKGTQSITTVQGETITLLTTEDGQTYAQANGNGGLIGKEGDQILMEALTLPDEMIAGYPVLQVVSASMAINPKSGEPVEMEVTADQPYIIDESQGPRAPIGPQASTEITATIESVELVYFTPNQRYAIPDPTAGPVYIQPAWHFQGHYWDGSEFEILVQALKDEFLLPEIETVEPPG